MHKQLKARNVSTAGAVHQSVIPDTFDSLSSQQRIIKLKVTQYFHAYHYIILTEVLLAVPGQFGFCMYQFLFCYLHKQYKGEFVKKKRTTWAHAFCTFAFCLMH